MHKNPMISHVPKSMSSTPIELLQWTKMDYLESDICSTFQTKNSFALICKKGITFYHPKENTFYQKDIRLPSRSQHHLQFHNAQQFDDKNNLLYYQPDIFALLGITSTWKVWNGIKCEKIHNSTNEWSKNVESILFNDELHLIGGTNAVHHSYNPVTKQYRNVTNSIECIASNTRHTSIKLFQSPKKKKIYLTVNRNIYFYSLQTNNWEQLPVCLPESMEFYKVVALENDIFLFLFGHENCILIHVLELKSLTITKCKISCPIPEPLAYAVFNDKWTQTLLTFGYVRYVWNDEDFDSVRYPPNDLIQMITSYGIIEKLHIFWRIFHWKVNVQEILNKAGFA